MGGVESRCWIHFSSISICRCVIGFHGNFQDFDRNFSWCLNCVKGWASKIFSNNLNFTDSIWKFENIILTGDYITFNYMRSEFRCQQFDFLQSRGNAIAVRFTHFGAWIVTVSVFVRGCYVVAFVWPVVDLRSHALRTRHAWCVRFRFRVVGGRLAVLSV